MHNNGVLHKSLSTLLPEHNVTFCDADDIIGGILDNTASLFVMPGGADLYYCEKLNGKGNHAIKEYVENGGNYLGICAGAYYACREIEWAKNTGQEITGRRELGFIDCKAVGPVYDFIENGDVNSSWDNVTTLETKDGQCSVIYKGGPLFFDTGNPDIKTLGYYKDLPENPAAVIYTQVGKGNVILSSPHIEFDQEAYKASLYQNANSSYQWQKSVAEKFSSCKNTVPLKILKDITDIFNL